MTLALRRISPRLLIGLAALALFWYAVRAVSWRELWSIFAGLGLGDLLLLTAVNGVVLLIFTSRWWLFLTVMGHRLPYLRTVGYRLAAFGVSYFTPGPHFGGEPLQVYLVHRRDDVPMSAAIATVTMDKVLELFANFTFLALGLLWIVQQQVLSASIPAGRAVLYMVLLAALPLSLLTAYGWAYHPLAWLTGRLRLAWPVPVLQRLHEAIHQGEDQMIWLCRRRPDVMLLALMLSLLIWVAIVGEFWLSIYLLGFDLHLGEVVAVLIAARIAILLPLPAGIGALEAGLAFAMESLGYGAAAGISLSLLIRTRDVILGLIGLWIGGVDVWSAVTGKGVHGQRT